MKNLWAVFGFIIFTLGLCSLILHSVGIQFAFLSFINSLQPLIRFIVHLFMIFAGVVIMYLNLVNWRKDETREEFS